MKGVSVSLKARFQSSLFFRKVNYYKVALKVVYMHCCEITPEKDR